MPGLDLILIALAYAPRLERRPTRADLGAALENLASAGRRRARHRARGLTLAPLVLRNRLAVARRIVAR